MEQFAKNLREMLKESELSQSDLARKIKVSSHTINKYCLGKNEPSFKTLRLLCRTLNCTYEELIGPL